MCCYKAPDDEGSGKSFSILQWLYFLSSGKEAETNLVVCSSYPNLQNIIQDYQRSCGMTVEGSQIYGYNSVLPNGSRFIFKAYDDYTKCQGSSCTRLYVNEVLNVDEAIVTTLCMSASKQIYMDYNPTKKSFVDKYIQPDKSNFLKTTYLDNPHLPPEQIFEFDQIRLRAMSPTATVLDRYAYQVYVLGEFSSMAGKVFKQIWNCTDDEYTNIRATEIYGLDFGWTDNNDKSVLIGAKIFNNTLYLKEYVFSDTLSKDYDLAWALVDSGVTPYDTVFADYGGMGKTRITNLVTANNGEWSESPINKGFNIANAVKGRVIDGIQKMLQFERIYVTDTSIHLRDEMDRYELNEDGKEVGKHQNCVDAARYAAVSMIAMGYK